jgi:hypothetical protein
MHGWMVAPRTLRRLVLAATACASLLAGCISAAPASAAALPTQGIFENCPLDSQLGACEQRLSTMHSGGLQVVVIQAWGVSLDSLSQYAAAARGLGMSVMWELSDPAWWQQAASGTGAASSFSQFASACGCSNNGDLLAYVVRWLAALPGTYGYYAADDSMISPGDEAGVASYVARIKQQDAGHMVLIGAANTGQGQQYEQGTVAQVGQEMYPVSTGSLLPASANQGTWDSINFAASTTQHAADQAGKQSVAIIQAFSWGDNVDDGSAIGVCNSADTTASCAAKLRYPSGAEQLALRNSVLSNSRPQLMLWYSFTGTSGFAQTNTYNAPISPDEAAARWAGLSAAIQAPAPSAASSSATAAALRGTTHASVKKHHRRKHAHKASRHKHHKKRKRHK